MKSGAKMGSAMNYRDRIVRDPHVAGGEPSYRLLGTTSIPSIRSV
jgi:hypothetical protein